MLFIVLLFCFITLRPPLLKCPVMNVPFGLNVFTCHILKSDLLFHIRNYHFHMCITSVHMWLAFFVTCELEFSQGNKISLVNWALSQLQIFTQELHTSVSWSMTVSPVMFQQTFLNVFGKLFPHHVLAICDWDLTWYHLRMSSLGIVASWLPCNSFKAESSHGGRETIVTIIAY